jgi:BAAT / Acyl-CoA thioester hydrolase C terminal
VAHVDGAEFGNPDPEDHPDVFIRAERISGPVLTFSGGDDLLWPSSSYMTVLEQRLDKRHFARPHRDVDYGTAGHLLGSAIPYLPAATASGYGGSPAADAVARAALSLRMLAFMRGLRGA